MKITIKDRMKIQTIIGSIKLSTMNLNIICFSSAKLRLRPNKDKGKKRLYEDDLSIETKNKKGGKRAKSFSRLLWNKIHLNMSRI